MLMCDILDIEWGIASPRRGMPLPALRLFAHVVEVAHTDVIETRCAFLQTVDVWAAFVRHCPRDFASAESQNDFEHVAS